MPPRNQARAIEPGRGYRPWPAPLATPDPGNSVRSWLANGCVWSSSGLPVPVQHPVAHRLRHVRAANGVDAGQVSDGTGHLEDAVIGPGREPQLVHGALQQVLTLGIRLAVPVDLAGTEPCVRFTLPRQLPFACRSYAHSDRLAHFAVRRRIGPERLLRHPRRLHVQVDAVQQRAGYLGTIALHLVRRAMAASGRVAEIAARAGVHG